MTFTVDRRTFLGNSGLSALHLFVLGCHRSKEAGIPSTTEQGIKPAVAQPASDAVVGLGTFAQSTLPVVTVGDFKYMVIQRSGQTLSDGHILGAQPDGMACFQDAQGRYVLLRNQELGALRFLKKYGVNDALFKDGKRPVGSYNESMFGGVTRVVLDPAKLAKNFSGSNGGLSTAVVESQYVLLGTDRNCAGGEFENQWITCEESSEPGHGYAFITHRDDSTLVKPRRIDSWGRMHREAVSVHKASGITYMTEDRRDGCFYRFVPKNANDPFGEGILQALKITGLKTTDPYPEPKDGVPVKSVFKTNQSWDISWVVIDDPSAAKLTCREQGHQKGATIFNRCEGITQDRAGIWFTASLGGPAKGGQIFQLPHVDGDKPQQLSLKYEVTDRSQLSCPDNLTVAPWGELILAEDNYARSPEVPTQFVRCMKQDGTIYPLLKINEALVSGTRAGPEFTGACFSPDGKYFFVNVQSPLNITIAVTGPWPKA
jgi:uncharacterized protein